MSWIIWLRSCWILPPQWNFDGPEMTESASSLDIARFSNLYFFKSTWFIFSIKVPIDSSILEADFSFQSIDFQFFSPHQNWNPDWPELTKVLLVETYLEILTHPSQKLQLWIPLPSIKLMLSYYYLILKLKNFWFHSLDWNFDEPNMRRSSKNFIV